MVWRGSAHKWLPFSDEEYSNLPAPRDMREIALQIWVGAKAGVEIGHNQERVTGDSYEGVKNLWRGGTRSIE